MGISEPAEPASQTWGDNYLCVPPTSPYQFTWTYSDAAKATAERAGNTCIQWIEIVDPHTWKDNYLCNAKIDKPDPRQHSSNQGKEFQGKPQTKKPTTKKPQTKKPNSRGGKQRRGRKPKKSKGRPRGPKRNKRKQKKRKQKRRRRRGE